MMMKTEGLGRTDEGIGSCAGGRCIGGLVVVGGVYCPISDSWDRYMSPEYVVLPDMSDSDRHCGPGIQNFLLFPIP